MECRGFPGPGAAKQRVLFNPMREYIHSDDSHVQHAFTQFKADHGKDYETEDVHNERLHAFRQNLRHVLAKMPAFANYKNSILLDLSSLITEKESRIRWPSIIWQTKLVILIF